MAKILLDHADGRYATRLLSAKEAADLEAQGTDVTYVEDHVYDAYLRHCEQDGVWQALWRTIANEQYIHRREQALLPLEEAQREIDRLREELARSERMHRYYEEELATFRADASVHPSP
jgi:predicted N-formylglutamate amidohydrolase